MHLVDINPPSVGEDVVIDFDSTIQKLSALEAAAYRLIGTATCDIQREDDKFICRLAPISNSLRYDELRVGFLNLVTDENLRATIAEKTEGVRNVILALAFGALAASEK